MNKYIALVFIFLMTGCYTVVDPPVQNGEGVESKDENYFIEGDQVNIYNDIDNRSFRRYSNHPRYRRNYSWWSDFYYDPYYSDYNYYYDDYYWYHGGYSYYPYDDYYNNHWWQSGDGEDGDPKKARRDRDSYRNPNFGSGGQLEPDPLPAGGVSSPASSDPAPASSNSNSDNGDNSNKPKKDGKKKAKRPDRRPR
ncbi:MAG: hypothetical protein HN729_03530 [Candidatus Marinimicrobia bacterium]|jgi:hypothetical protein|nr:hypothetical protein [Candidatus Neomarinimicrobiota bacterium]MBT3635156.1 hypothetical protein [Candidatus Neomarinimicrobiota bacterium]MBT3683810.1 hypothetical protein [Candidatus Neomarinimicrobiota bacterium]MBT3760798.1 hypothetical protein [Candidatus Neomarinimicrobiota bacterium]MBT3896969.1 hypothetical protein [Candidatus Neomarinimicrobiota bacterium]